MQYEWIKNVAYMSPDYTTIFFNYDFNQKIEPNSLPENLISLTFGVCFNQKIYPNNLPINLINLTFGSYFNQGIDPNTLPKNLISLTFGWEFNQKIEPNTLSENVTTLTFGNHFNQGIDPNTLPENLTTIIFGECFNQNIDQIMLPFSLKNIKFNWMNLYTNYPIGHCVKMVNNIPSYYHVEILLKNNIFNINGPKWSINVVNYKEHEWSSEIYEIQDKYIHPKHGSIIVLINKKTYQPCSFAKSARK